ncbi:3' terminal RNA ribose 2'-O-methyltransferase Hen1 [Nonomuraea soli]|uniref:Small RNA 2'-O-methyltransferase n=1 Tax=Nonomuraea soli TaxID=1032476 RepID=A0A7W0HSW5_9ACTN|nr:3' terminal RNA ribose 2'-O-methyltransferase Hen1 [Nonomuraea soli]MBA2894459.1 2-polyprenyl-3-methyl-5-hydroxy-6-metoxy-1,4-benzoquinol methylase [Nonomuraea soli]
MLLTITTTLTPATDLGFLLHKHPDRVQEFSHAFGTATVFYPEASEQRCTAALMLEIDPVRLVRTRSHGSPDFSLSQYVNDRPYAASSLLAVALGDVFRTARAGRCNARPELAARPLPLEIALPALPCRGGPELAHRLFEPLGWEVEAAAVPLDDAFASWGDSRYVTLTLRGSLRLADALNHLYVLLPVLDDSKHYWIAPDEVDKLVRAGEGWLAGHPERALITRRYLGRRSSLARTALARLAELGDEVEEALEPAVAEEAVAGETALDEVLASETWASADADAAPSAGDPASATSAAVPVSSAPASSVPVAAEPEDRLAAAEAPTGKPAPLNTLRREAVLSTLADLGATSVIDLGCGGGELVGALLSRPRFTRVAGTDVSPLALTIAARKLKLDRMPDAKSARLTLFQSALTYTDKRFAGYDAAVLMEVVEHVDPPRLTALERVVFGHAKPQHVIVTTPNIEYNVRYEFLTGLRHNDHRFEWTRQEFAAWAEQTATQYGYSVRYAPVGEPDPDLGPPTQMAIFTLGPAKEGSDD